jgi:chemotaxis protein methyltransferase CheR
MALLRRFPPGTGWTLSLLATDISTRALSHAKAATYQLERTADIGESLRRSYMVRAPSEAGSSPAALTFVPSVRELVQFRPFNLMEKDYAALGEFDLIFCRNVMIYFQAQTRREVVDRLLSRLRPGGFLFLGHAESLIGFTERARRVAPTIYAQSAGE